MEAHGHCDIAGTLPDVLEFMRHRLPWPLVLAGAASLLAVLVAWGEVHNWGVFLQFLYHVPYGANDPLYDKDIGFYAEVQGPFGRP